MKKLILSVVVVTIAGLAIGYHGIVEGWFGKHEAPGQITAQSRPSDVVGKIQQDQTDTALQAGVEQPKQILFGDLHVHTTFSTDAFATSLPLLGGVGAHPPADACDFARFCSALDFWSINDHAENMPHQHWREIVDTIRQCNAASGDPNNPDMVSYLGWEWTQVGTEPANHYGHKNVVLADLQDDRIPARPIASGGQARSALQVPGWLSAVAVLTQPEDRYWTMTRFLAERRNLQDCPKDTPVRDMPAQCYEEAETPADLFAKLDDWDVRSMVIPHGTTWGFYTPPGSSWDKQLKGPMHDPNRQTMIEVYSGHGNSEEYRDWRAATYSDPSDLNTAECPAPTEGYLPSCWRAGQIIRQRCEAAGNDEATCDGLEAKARKDYVRAGAGGHIAIPGETMEDWLDAGQCTDCFQPAFNYRSASSAQYIMALTNFDDPEKPRNFRFGFMASSDNHSARPGTGYKELNRQGTTENIGPASEATAAITRAEPKPPLAESYTFKDQGEVLAAATNAFQVLETERQASFFVSGGLIAAHSNGRDRDSIWQAMERREVYGTSGPRILLWFNLDNGPDGSVPMGSEIGMNDNPRFTVRAAGSFKQKPGCPDYATNAMSPERIAYVCQNECYNPSDERRIIDRIEIIRIRPQSYEGEPVAELIDDPWQTFECDGDPAGCSVSFEDPEFANLGRNTLYYARAIEEESLAINAGNLRCDKDSDGNCIKVNPCYGGYRTEKDDNCLAPTQQRAWSSPIFVNFQEQVAAKD